MEAQSRLSPQNRTVLFYSRGRGHGHAIPDMAIADELLQLQSAIDLRLVSYGTGAETFRAHDRFVIDLQLPDANPLWETVLRAGQLIRDTQPGLVISHEEFSILPVAKIFGVPTVLITEWFSDPDHLQMQALVHADEVICIENEGVFDVTPSVEGKVYYAGPVLRPFSYSRGDRERARQELGIPQDATVILVIPGGWATEAKEPIYDLLVPAFNMLKVPGKLLVWMAGADYEMLQEHLEGRADVIVKERDWQIDRLMVASNLAITKANRVTLRELAALGIPSISISHGHNRIDDVLIERIPTNMPLDARTANPRMLTAAMLEVIREAEGNPVTEPLPTSPPGSEGAMRAAQRLACHIEKLVKRAGPSAGSR